jgi:valyl-tRNA synthetase
MSQAEPRPFDHVAIEAECRALWEREGIYGFDPDSTAPVFSVDTPPPYVSASHLHVGHAMSYAQADFIVRYKRMRGFNVYYPMGFDDNGLPTERYVEQKYGIKATEMSREEFVKLCLEETRATAKIYEELWRKLALSVDWNHTYSTIDERCQRTAQGAFIKLYEAGYLRRQVDAIIWCPECQTALAQADVDDLERNTQLHQVAFKTPDGADAVIATTRPELLPACVALYMSPGDPRYASLIGGEVVVPFTGHTVPVKESEAVDPEFGTGLMMVCTFGDSEDVAKWRADGLETRVVLGPNGRMLPDAGELAGLSTSEARKRVVERGKEEGWILGSTQLKQRVGVHERCSTPIEYQIRPQWFVDVQSSRDRLRARGDELDWKPAHMARRLEAWIDGLKWDWNISRQRYYGVPFPVWFCASCEQPIMAPLDDLPVDPLSRPAPVDVCPSCGAGELRPDPDVMDTWMTSSLSPQINSDWAKHGFTTEGQEPMSLRVQAFEIIRTWLFYSVVQSEYHFGRIPWHTVMISGWGLNEQGKKISKRDLEANTDAEGYNRYVPDSVIERFGADAVRGWATGSRLGNDLRYSEKDVRAARKFAVKVWNAGILIGKLTDGWDMNDRPPIAERNPLDQWVLDRLCAAVNEATTALDEYEFAHAYNAASRFFWETFCDRYLELAKEVSRADDERRWVSTAATLDEAFRIVLGLFAPFAPHVTEAVYQERYAAREGQVSVHTTTWPEPPVGASVPIVDQAMAVLDSIRAVRTQLRLGASTRVDALVLDARDDEARALVAEAADILQAAARAEAVEVAGAESPTKLAGLFFDLRLAASA